MEKDYIKINQNAYDILASEYKEKYKDDKGANIFYDLIKQMVINRKTKVSQTLLEIGPGTGVLLNILESSGLRTTAVELSNNMASISSENSPDSIIINNNILDINFMPKQFDFILAMAVIHNFPEKDLIKLLNKIKTWIKDEGYFIIDTTNNKITENGYFKKEDYNQKVMRYRRKWKKEDLEEFMKSQQFNIVESINYIDECSNKEWLVYCFKVNKGR